MKILSKPAMVERSRHFGKEIPFEEQLSTKKMKVLIYLEGL